MSNKSFEYYSYSKQISFRCAEKWLRYAQSTLLLYLVFCFIFYMITFGIDIAKLSNSAAYLAISLAIDLLAMASIAIGVRGVALEIWPLIISFTVAIVIVTAGHVGTFLFRRFALNLANVCFDSGLALLALVFVALLCRFEALKPADYDIREQHSERSSRAKSRTYDSGSSPATMATSTNGIANPATTASTTAVILEGGATGEARGGGGGGASGNLRAPINSDDQNQENRIRNTITTTTSHAARIIQRNESSVKSPTDSAVTEIINMEFPDPVVISESMKFA